MRRIIIGAAVFGLALGVGGMAYASIPSPTGVITGCVQKSSGQVRIIDTAKESCKSVEQTVPWNQAGQAGTNGTNGVSGWEVYSTLFGFGQVTGSIGVGQVNCPSGKVVTGGGAKFVRPGGGQAILATEKINVTASYPKDDGTGWAATWDASDIQAQGVFGIQVYAICVNAN